MESKLTLRDWITATILFIVVLTVVLVPRYVQNQVNEAALNIACTSAEANIQQLKAIQRNGVVLDDIAHSLGLPVPMRPFIPIPEVPPECADP